MQRFNFGFSCPSLLKTLQTFGSSALMTVLILSASLSSPFVLAYDKPSAINVANHFDVVQFAKLFIIRFGLLMTVLPHSYHNYFSLSQIEIVRSTKLRYKIYRHNF